MSKKYVMTAAPLPVGFRGTPQQWFEQMLARMSFLTDGNEFVVSDTMPEGNQGPWLKGGKEWWVWDENSSTYVPQSLSYLRDQVWIGDVTNPPDPTRYAMWLQTNGASLVGIFWYSGTAWVTTPSPAEAMLNYYPRVGTVEWHPFPLPDAVDGDGVIAPSTGTIFVEPYGQSMPKTYSRLYAVIGDRYLTTGDLTDPAMVGRFRMPNYRGKFLRGRTAVGTEANTSGADSVTLTVAQLPAHHHTQQYVAGGGGGNGMPDSGWNANATKDTSDTGGGAAVDIRPKNIEGVYYMVAGYNSGGEML